MFREITKNNISFLSVFLNEFVEIDEHVNKERLPCYGTIEEPLNVLFDRNLRDHSSCEVAEVWVDLCIAVTLFTVRNHFLENHSNGSN